MEKSNLAIINSDPRGNLGVINFDQIPFVPKRFFWLFGIPEDTPRAGHGHKNCEQFLMCQSGTINIKITDRNLSSHYFNLEPGDCVHLKTFNWLELLKFSSDAILGVWASEKYDREEYIETYIEFLALINS